MNCPAKLGREATSIGINLANKNQRTEALEYFNRALDYFEEINNESERREELFALATVLDYGGFPELCIMTIQGAIDIDKTANNKKNLAIDLLTYGIAQSNLGNLDEALSFNNQAHEIALSIGDYADAASALTNIAGLTFNSGDKTKAINMLYKSLEYLRKESFPDTERRTLITLVQVLELEDRPTEEIFDAASGIVKYADHLQSNESEVLRDSLSKTVNRYVRDNPGINASEVKRKFVSGLFEVN